MLSLIVARTPSGAIGRDGDIPWRKPADLAFFKRETLGGAVIMGRKTWESLPFRPLKDRLNIVVSRQTGLHDTMADSPEDALRVAQDHGLARSYGIGGSAIYAALLPLAHRLLITEIEVDVPDADTFFPDLDPAEWREVARLPLGGDGPPAQMRELLRA